MKLRRVLVANRGEIAIRVFRACREAGIETVAIYSDADAGAPHVRAADHALRIGPPPARDSYLNVEAILAAARDISADAVHPGYGFLSENAGFARACETAGLVFIGPAAETIETMGSKIAARALMESAGVPVVPGATPHDQSDEGVLAAAKAIGLPALVKASAGGGGKGMRLLSDASSAVEEIRAARREATSAFGDGTLYIERLHRPAAPYRDPGLRRRPRRGRPPVRARVLGSAAPPESHRRESVNSDQCRRPAAHGRGGRPGRTSHSLPRCGNDRVPTRRVWRRCEVLFPRDEHAPSGRAPGH